MADTRFVLLAVPVSRILDSEDDLTIPVAALRENDDDEQPVRFVNQTDLQLEAPDADEMHRLMTGASIELMDEMPIGMDTFRENVMRLREHPTLAEVS